MPETCEYCGNPMKDWSATHCSEICLMSSIKNSKTLHEGSVFDKLLSKMKQENHFDRKLLDDSK